MQLERLTTAARQGDKTTTSGYQARQSCAYDRTGNGRNRGEQDIPGCGAEGVEIEERDRMRKFVVPRPKWREAGCR